MEILSPWMLYCWTRVDAIGTLFSVLGFASIILIVILFAVLTSNNFGEWDWVDEYPDEVPDIKKFENDNDGYRNTQRALKIKAKKSYAKRLFNWCILCVIIISTLNVAIPSQKDLAIIYVIPKVLNNETIQNEGLEIYTVAKTAWIDYLDIKTTTKKEKPNDK